MKEKDDKQERETVAIVDPNETCDVCGDVHTDGVHLPSWRMKLVLFWATIKWSQAQRSTWTMAQAGLWFGIALIDAWICVMSVLHLGVFGDGIWWSWFVLSTASATFGTLRLYRAMTLLRFEAAEMVSITSRAIAFGRKLAKSKDGNIGTDQDIH